VQRLTEDLSISPGVGIRHWPTLGRFALVLGRREVELDRAEAVGLLGLAGYSVMTLFFEEGELFKVARGNDRDIAENG
jgi:hypothetical protein